MSSYWAGCHGVALMLTMEEATEIIKKYMKTFPDSDNAKFLHENGIECNFEECTFSNAYGENAFEMFFISPDYCDGMFFIPFKHSDGKDNVRASGKVETYAWRDKDTVAIFTNRGMDSMEAILNPPYKTYEDLLNEFTGKLKGLVPDDFNWYDRIGSISFASFA